jgi:hypothetical protein
LLWSLVEKTKERLVLLGIPADPGTGEDAFFSDPLGWIPDHDPRGHSRARTE